MRVRLFCIALSMMAMATLLQGIMVSGQHGQQDSEAPQSESQPMLTPPRNPFEVRVDNLEPPVVGKPWPLRVVVSSLLPAHGAVLQVKPEHPLRPLGVAGILLDLAPGIDREHTFWLLLEDRLPSHVTVELDYRTPSAHYFPSQQVLIDVDADGLSAHVGWLPFSPKDPNAPQASRAPGILPREILDSFVREDDEGTALDAVGTITVTGQAVFFSRVPPEVAYQGVHFAAVEIWDADVITGDDLLATVCTDGNGNFNSGPLDQGDESGTLDLYIRVRTPCSPGVELVDPAGNRRVYSNLDSSNPTCKVGVQDNVPDGMFDFGACDPPLGEDEFWVLHDYAEFAIDRVHFLGFDPGIVKLMVPAGGQGAFYNPNTDTIHIPDVRYISGPDVLSHETGHFIMDKVYGFIPPIPNCVDHIITLPSSGGCAWVEGWANYYAVETYVGTFRWRDDTGTYNSPNFAYNFEANPGIPGPPDTNKDSIEGTVAGTLWDLVDDLDDGEDGVDQWTWSGIWSRFLASAPDLIFPQYRDAWPLGPARRDFVHTAWQNQIDYDFLSPTTIHMGPVGGGWLRGNVPVNAVSIDDDSDVEHVDFGWSNDAACAANNFIDVDSTSPYATAWATATVPDQPLGSVFICETGASLDGTHGPLDIEGGFGIDNTPPEGSVTSPPTGGPASYTISWASNDAMSGIVSVNLQEAAGGGAFVTVCTNGAAGSCERNPTEDETYRYRAIVTDGAGNEFTTPESATRNREKPKGAIGTGEATFNGCPPGSDSLALVGTVTDSSTQPLTWNFGVSDVNTGRQAPCQFQDVRDFSGPWDAGTSGCMWSVMGEFFCLGFVQTNPDNSVTYGLTTSAFGGISGTATLAFIF